MYVTVFNCSAVAGDYRCQNKANLINCLHFCHFYRTLMSLSDDKRKYRLAVIVDADNQPSVLSLDALKSTE